MGHPRALWGRGKDWAGSPACECLGECEVPRRASWAPDACRGLPGCRVGSARHLGPSFSPTGPPTAGGGCSGCSLPWIATSPGRARRTQPSSRWPEVPQERFVFLQLANASNLEASGSPGPHALSLSCSFGRLSPSVPGICFSFSWEIPRPTPAPRLLAAGMGDNQGKCLSKQLLSLGVL